MRVRDYGVMRLMRSSFVNMHKIPAVLIKMFFINTKYDCGGDVG